MKRFFGLTVWLFIALNLAACGRWSLQRQDARSEALFGDVLLGMSLQEFHAAYSDAKQVPGTESGTAFLIVTNDACFWCYSGRGFKESEDVFGRIVRFDNGVLSSSQPVHVGEDQ